MCVTWETRKATRLSCIDPVEVGLGRRGRASGESYPSSGRNFKDSPALTHGSFLLLVKKFPLETDRNYRNSYDEKKGMIKMRRGGG